MALPDNPASSNRLAAPSTTDGRSKQTTRRLGASLAALATKVPSPPPTSSSSGGRIVASGVRGSRDLSFAEARTALDTAYAWLEQRLAGRAWAAGKDFSMADCAAAPSLFYADWTHPIPEGMASVKAYRARLLARPSFARAVDEARPYRPFFPLGAPDRD